jgi:hypothetical protein
VLLPHHGPDSKIPTQKDGHHTNDYIFTSEAVADQVVSSCEAMHFNKIMDSGHWALFLDLQVNQILLGAPSMFLSPAALRGIDSMKNPKLCKAYIQAFLLLYLGNRHIFP